MAGQSRQRGSAILTLGLVGATVTVAILLLLGGQGRAANAARAQGGADAVALAAAADDDEAGRRIASLNNVKIVSFQRDGDQVTVSVESGGIIRSATAIWELAWLPPARAD